MAPLLDRRRGLFDRRRAPRAQFVASVRDAETPRLFLSQDLGPRGMTVLRADTQALCARSSLLVEFELPGGTLVQALARVAHDRTSARGRSTGLEFVHLGPPQATLLDAYVKGAALASLPARAAQVDPGPLPLRRSA